MLIHATDGGDLGTLDIEFDEIRMVPADIGKQIVDADTTHFHSSGVPRSGAQDLAIRPIYEEPDRAWLISGRHSRKTIPVSSLDSSKSCCSAK